MARSNTARISFSFEGTLTNDSSGASDITTVNKTHSFANGTGANQAQRAWGSDGRILAGSAAEDLDMFDLAAFDIGAGAGNDALGLSHAITGVKGLYVHNEITSGGSIVVGGKSTSAAWNSMFGGDDDAAITLAPGATFQYVDPTAAGLAVTDTSNHLLTVTDSGSGSTYNIHFIGI